MKDAGYGCWIIQAGYWQVAAPLKKGQGARPRETSFYSLVLPSIQRRIRDEFAGASRLQSNEVLSALSGETVSGWRSYPDGSGIVVSAAAPIRINGIVHGVVLVEETTSGIQLQQRQAMASLLNKTLLAFYFLLCWFLLLFCNTIIHADSSAEQGSARRHR